MKQNTNVIFDSPSHCEWRCNHGNSYALCLPDRNVKSYGAFNDHYVRSTCIINNYIGKHDIFQEILCSVPFTGKFMPLSPIAYANVIGPEMSKDATLSGGRWFQHIMPMERDGRILFGFSKDVWHRFLASRGVSLESIHITYAAAIVSRFRSMLTFASMNPDKITNVDEMEDALSSIIALGRYRIEKKRFYEGEIAHCRAGMANELTCIKDIDRRFDEICSISADALNELSEKYGIAVNI